jgi:hypothetical protein
MIDLDSLALDTHELAATIERQICHRAGFPMGSIEHEPEHIPASNSLHRPFGLPKPRTIIVSLRFSIVSLMVKLISFLQRLVTPTRLMLSAMYKSGLEAVVSVNPLSKSVTGLIEGVFGIAHQLNSDFSAVTESI